MRAKLSYAAIAVLFGISLVFGGRALYRAATDDGTARAAQVYDRAVQAMDGILAPLGPNSTFHQRYLAYTELDGVRYVEQWASFGPDGLLEDIGLLVTDEGGTPLSETIREGDTVSVRYLDTGITIRLGVIGQLSVDDLRTRLAEAFEQQLGDLTAPRAEWKVEQFPDEILLQRVSFLAPPAEGPSEGAAAAPPRVRTVSHIDPSTYVTRKWESFQETSDGWKLVEWRENLVFEVVPRGAFVAPVGAR